MALDTSLIKPDNLLATGPTAANTAVPSKVTQLTGQNIWEYEFSNTWPQTGVWTITLNADGFSIAKGTVLGSFSVTQGTVYKMAVNWAATNSVETLSTKVTALEPKVTTLETKVAALEPKVTALEGGRATVVAFNTLQAAVNALAVRIETLEIDVVTHTH
jgi:outer membrane murein-binding lipoprotein Lpp